MTLTALDLVVMLLGALAALASHRLFRKPLPKDDRSSL